MSASASSPDLRLTVQGSSGNIANFTNGSEDFVIYQDNSNSQIANTLVWYNKN